MKLLETHSTYSKKRERERAQTQTITGGKMKIKGGWRMEQQKESNDEKQWEKGKQKGNRNKYEKGKSELNCSSAWKKAEGRGERERREERGREGKRELISTAFNAAFLPFCLAVSAERRECRVCRSGEQSRSAAVLTAVSTSCQRQTFREERIRRVPLRLLSLQLHSLFPPAISAPLDFRTASPRALRFFLSSHFFFPFKMGVILPQAKCQRRTDSLFLCCSLWPLASFTIFALPCFFSLFPLYLFLHPRSFC